MPKVNGFQCFNYTILQPNRDSDHRFRGLKRDPDDWTKVSETEVQGSEYQEIYEGEVFGKDEIDVLEKLFVKFNEHHPKDYSGYSMSVGHMVRLQSTAGLDKTEWYCEPAGWAQIKVV